MAICRKCGSTASQAADDALVVGFEKEFYAGVYDCCQVVGWADEQWLAWAEAAAEDGKSADEVTKRLEMTVASAHLPPSFVHFPLWPIP